MPYEFLNINKVNTRKYCQRLYLFDSVNVLHVEYSLTDGFHVLLLTLAEYLIYIVSIACRVTIACGVTIACRVTIACGVTIACKVLAYTFKRCVQ